MKEKISVAVLYGGNSSEFEISVLSAENIVNSLSEDKYEVYKVLIQGQNWTAYDQEGNTFPVDKNNFSAHGKPFDLAFPAIHGTPGEDGLLQGYFQSLNIPFTGSPLLTSALTFNKYFCNQFLRNYNVRMANSVLLRKGMPFVADDILDKTGLPCFVKPNEGGSSFGISKVKKRDELQAAINHAFTESDEVIVEQFIEGTEVTCGLFKTARQDYIFAPAEIVSKNEFFDYQAKYNSEYNEEIVPARISEALISEVQAISSRIYDWLNCKGIVRMDYILKANEFYFLEVNTIPGMTAESIVPKMMRHAGMTYGQAADIIIEEVLKKEY